MSSPSAKPAIAARSDRQPSTGASAPPRWLRLAQAGWAVTALLALGIYVASIPSYGLSVVRNPFAGRGIDAPAGLLHAVFPVGSLLLFATPPLCLGLAGLLVWRKPGDRMVLFVSFYLLLYGIVWAGPLDQLYLLLSGADSLHNPLAALHPLAFWWATLVLLALFPTGRFVPSWTRWLALLATLTAPLLVAIAFQWFQAVPTLWLLWPSLLYMFVTFTAAGYGQVYRYRHVSSPPERQQTKWAVSGLVVAVLLIQVELVLFTILFILWPPHAALPWWTLVFGLVHTVEVNLVPLTLTVAVLHYRVFDIDLLIRRTLVYGTLTALLAAVYFGSVIGMQHLVSALAGSQAGDNPLIIVLSTLLIAALATPLRRRIQATIDRRFYRRKYVAAQTLAAFGATLRHEMDLAQLSEQLMAVVQETMQPAHVSLWLRPASDGSPGEPSGPSQLGDPVTAGTMRPASTASAEPT